MTTITAEFRAERARLATNGHRPAKARTPVLVVLAGVLGTLARFVARHLPRWSQVRTLVLQSTALVMLSAAAWGVDWRFGLAVGAVGLLVLESLSGPART